jgi:hypothetical protein
MRTRDSMDYGNEGLIDSLIVARGLRHTGRIAQRGALRPVEPAYLL